MGEQLSCARPRAQPVRRERLAERHLIRVRSRDTCPGRGAARAGGGVPARRRPGASEPLSDPGGDPARVLPLRGVQPHPRARFKGRWGPFRRRPARPPRRRALQRRERPALLPEPVPAAGGRGGVPLIDPRGPPAGGGGRVRARAFCAPPPGLHAPKTTTPKIEEPRGGRARGGGYGAGCFGAGGPRPTAGSRSGSRPRPSPTTSPPSSSRRT
jgi:hypothetical protein